MKFICILCDLHVHFDIDINFVIPGVPLCLQAFLYISSHKRVMGCLIAEAITQVCGLVCTVDPYTDLIL